MSRWPVILLLACVFATVAGAQTTQSATAVRCAVIGGMVDTGLWDALAERFRAQTGRTLEIVASGPKDGIDAVFRAGKCDLITLHSSDIAVNLVADGFAMEMRPWARNDMVLVGPGDDPAGASGARNAVGALRLVALADADLVVHSSAGANEVLRDLMSAGDIEFDPKHVTVLFDDRHRQALRIAAEKKAYTLVGRIPFLSGKIPNDGLRVVSQGDARLRRPYVVAVANPKRVAGARVSAARRLSEFLRSPETQAFLAEFGRGKYDQHPLFFPVGEASAATSRPAGTLLTVEGEVKSPLTLDADALAKLPRHEVTTKARDGKESTYTGVLVADVLKLAGVPLGNHQMRGENLELYVVIEASDGYRAVFSLADFDSEVADRTILLADRRDGEPISVKEGPLRVIVPRESLPSRWVRQVNALRVERAGQ